MISVTILVKNSEKYLNDVLDALKNFDEVLIGDTGSTDKTLEIASHYPNVKVVKIPFTGFGQTHNELAAKAKYDWIFSVDSDEVAEKPLIEEIQGLTLSEGAIYSVPRKNFYKGIWIKTCGWYPDRVFRLYHRKKTSFSQAKVHEAVISEGFEKIDLSSHLFHYPYQKVADFLSKMQLYTDLYALENCGKKAAGYWTAISHSMFSFFRSYIIKRGFLQGGVGFEISMYNAITAFYKYLKLRETSFPSHPQSAPK